MISSKILSVAFTLITSCFLIAAFSQPNAENQPPKVIITKPLISGKLSWNSVVPYSISVSDPEDGDSRYGEIANNEVLLEIKYLPDSAQSKRYLLERSKIDHQPLIWISRSTCFSCHAAQTKLIGPSFFLIAQRYRDQPTAVDSLAKKIIGGSTGTWGDLKMPPNPDLTIEQVKEIVKWILKNNNDPDQDFIAGVDGVFRTKEKPNKDAGRGLYILTAFYADHGPKNGGHADGVVRHGSKTGQQSILLKNIE